mgnify:CR=1 FL=1
MSNEKVKQGRRFVVGSKQATKSLKKGEVKELLIASDADPKILKDLLDLAEERKVPVKEAGTMRDLGKTFGINVGASAVAILR